MKPGTTVTVVAKGSLLGNDTFTGIYLGRNRMVTRIRDTRLGRVDIYNDDIITIKETS